MLRPTSSGAQIKVRDYESHEIAYTLPLSRLGGFDDVIERTYMPLGRNPRVYKAHLHTDSSRCIENNTVDKASWDRGDFFSNQRLSTEKGTMIVWAHFVRKPGVNDYGLPLKPGDKDVTESNETSSSNTEPLRHPRPSPPISRSRALPGSQSAPPRSSESPLFEPEGDSVEDPQDAYNKLIAEQTFGWDSDEE